MKKPLLFSLILLLSIFANSQNNCLEFDGADDYVTCGTINLSGSAITLEAWIKAESFQSSSPYIKNIMGEESSGNAAFIRLGDASLANNKLQFVLYFGSDQVKLDGNTALSANIWYHIAATYDGTDMKIYINGIEDASQNQSGSFDANSTFYFSKDEIDNRSFDGFIDEARVWNDARTEAEIRQNMYRELSDPSSEGNLIAYYKFNETSGTTAEDSKNSYDGTLYNYGSQTGYWQTSNWMVGPKNCMDFDGGLKTGSPDYASKSSNVTTAEDNFTMMAWMKPDIVTNGANGWRCVAYNGSDAGGYGIGINDSKLASLYGGRAWHNTDEVLTAGRWYHIALRRSSGTTEFFLDGVKLSYSSTTAPLAPAAVFSIGNMFQNNNTSIYTDSFDGKIDEVIVFSTALTDQQVADYATTSPQGNEANLAAYYNCNSSEGTTVYPIDGNSSNNLTLVNTSDDDWVNSYAMVLAEDATNVESTSFTANWDCPGTGSSFDDGYVIEYSSSPDFSGSSTATASSSATSKSITGLSANTMYFYRVSGKRSGSATTEYSNVKYNFLSTIVTSNSNDGVGTLRYIIENCDAEDEITVNLSSGNETISLSTPISIDKSITINGDNSAGSGTDITVQVTTPGTSTFRVFSIDIASDETVEFSNMTIMGGYLPTSNWAEFCYGGSVLFKGGGTLSLETTTIDGSGALLGGGVYCTASNLTLNECIVRNNKTKSGGSGGGIYASGSTVNITESTITNNTANDANNGAALCADNTTTITIDGCTLSNNSGVGQGGAISINSSSVATISNNTLNSNSASWGGAISVRSATATINNNSISSNSASYGGGIYNEEGTITLTGCVLNSNTASSNGGGIYLNEMSGESFTTLNNSTLHGNSATTNGGGIYANSEDMMWMGGIYLNLTITNSSMSGNSCSGSGAGIYSYDDGSAITNVYLANSIITYNAKGSAYEDVSNSNATLYGNYNIVGDFAITGSNNTNYSYTNGMGASLFSSYTTISSNAVYKPVLADNGGSTETVALATNSIAVGSGVRTGEYESSGTKYVFYDGSKWVKVEDGSTEISSGVTEITTDQRDDSRRQESPCKGSFECGNYYQIWTGNTSGSWQTASNWSPLSVPISTDNITIPEISSKASTLTIGATETADCNNLTIDANANLTIESTSSGTGSLIVHGTLSNSGTITSQSYLGGASQAWHMISGPSAVDISNNGWNPGDNDDFYAWKETSPGIWVNYKNTTTSPTFAEVNGGDNFVAAKGYLVAYEGANPTKTFTGTLNTGNKTFNLKNSGSKSWTYVSGWNLMGNPYSSSIDWNLATRTQFQDNYAYIYDPNKGGGPGYVYVNGASANAYIPPHQGFFVLASQAAHGQNFTFTNSMQTHGDGSNIYKSTNNDDVLVLRLTGNDYYDETDLLLDEQSSFNRDRRDALKMYSYNTSVPQLFSVSYDEIPLAVNSIPEVTTDKSISLGMRVPEQGIYIISIGQHSETLGVVGIYLEDHVQNTLHKLSDSEYSFMTQSGDINDRFTIHFGVVGIDEPITKPATIRTYASNNTLYILNPEHKQGTVTIYNLTGQQVTTFDLTGNTKQQHNVHSQSGTLNMHNMINIVKILTTDEATLEKVIFR